MSTPRRRSSRLRSAVATPGKALNHASNRLDSLAERDESPLVGPQSNLDAIISPCTPNTNGRIKPPQSEMHPSKAHQSTTQKPDSGLRLGFTDIQATGNEQPSGVTQQTPSKIGISDSSFQFTFARPGPQLGPEAQRMMDELREEALKIKAKLAAEREEEKRKGEESAATATRKIAQPKGKAGRFSDVHMAQFKKMDSIAGHASAFRAQPDRFTPTTNTLKRTQSKAQLDDRDSIQNQGGEISYQPERLENAAPAKRARKHVEDDTSSARPVSRGDTHKPLPATPTRPQSGTIASITTPTQASIARAANNKKPVTQIPTLTKSASRPNLMETPRRLTKSVSRPNLVETPRGLTKSISKPNLTETPKGLTKSATVNNFSAVPQTQSKSFLHSPNKLDRVKSILRYPSSQLKKPTSIPTLTRSPSKPNFEKSLPSLPVTPGRSNTASAAIKHVNFTPEASNKHAAMVTNSPSPVKSGIPKSTSKINFGMKPPTSTAHTKEVQYPSLGTQSGPSKSSGAIEYPSLAGVHPLPEPPRQPTVQQQRPPPSVPGTFSFRSDHTIDFGASPKGFGSSPGQSSVRQVRPSIMPNKMPGSFPGTNKENTPPMPSVPHGIANKKRRRVESDDEMDNESERSPKKHKSAVAEGPMLMAPKLQGPNATTKTSSPKKKGVLSLSRLNMLARPKLRR